MACSATIWSFLFFESLPSTSLLLCLISLYFFFIFKVSAPSLSCLKTIRYGESPHLLELPHANEEEPHPLVRCSRHLCPIQIHWHVKESYREYWRVKITINNLNLVKNYSQWNLVVLHPNLRNVTEVFSFNYQALGPYATISKLNQTTYF